MTSFANVASAAPAPRRGWGRWLIIGWLIAATCDICYATGFSYFYRSVPPSRILKLVASGILGTDAYQGGAGVAALGLALHYVNALIITSIFFAVASQAPALVRRPLLVGVLYGIVVYLVMNYVVVPLSRIGPRPTPPTATWVTGVLVHMFLIGVPIVWAARQAFANRGQTMGAVGSS
jgi:hypothetical protein